VANTTDGVEIKVEGRADDIDGFCKSLCPEAPAISHITHMSTAADNPEGFREFSVVTSRDSSPLTSEISPDIAVCDDCIADLKTQEHRINYPFINCTACGPRFSIIKDFPYDSVKTTMDVFEMCPVCRSEYTNIGDRRFHAEPVACNNCGPVYTLHHNGTVTNDFKAVLAGVRDLLDEGRTIAVKGVGGYHLMCDARNEVAVERLRESKRREGKPFAVMSRNMKL
jgi:hydrogenase maturation protein HypF